MYNRYAESARVNWTLNFAANDPQHKAEWMELMTPKSVGLILRSIKTDYKFVSAAHHGTPARMASTISLSQLKGITNKEIAHEMA
jgi:hypothetical protein